MDPVRRVKEINTAREKIGEDAFLGKDTDILLSFKHDLCESLVRNDDDYKSRLAEQQKREALELKDQERLFVGKRGEQEQIDREKRAAAARIKKEKRTKTFTIELAYRCRKANPGSWIKQGGSLLFSTRTARTTWLKLKRYERRKRRRGSKKSFV